MPQVSLVDVASYLPGDPVPTDYFTQFSRSERMAKNVMFRSPTGRHHIGRDETAVDMAEQAFAQLRERHGADLAAEIGAVAFAQLGESLLGHVDGGLVASRRGGDRSASGT